MNRFELKNFTLTDGEITVPAVVPGDISADLYSAKIIPDPFYADNFKSLGWIQQKDWTYSTVFDWSEFRSASIAELVFEGIDVFSEIYLNGKLLGKTDNAFKKYVFDVTDFLLEKDNLLQVKMLTTYGVIEGFDNPGVAGLFNEKRFYTRKMQCAFGWDWAPNFIGYGISGNVYIENKECLFLRDIDVECNIDGRVFFNVELNKNEECLVRITTNGETTEHIISTEISKIERFVENPLLWNPRGYGEPNLYAYSVELLYKGKCVDKKSGVLGFRKIEVEQIEKEDGKASFAFIVNGKKIFAKGSNFVPITNLSGIASEYEYEVLLSAAKQAGYNMIRVWGGGIYEKEIFYSLCDRYGIIVWQDFMLSCSEASALSFYKRQIEEEAVYQIKRLNAHPCVCIWCGGNEMWGGGEEKEALLKVDLMKLCERYAHSCIYLPNSPFSLGDADIWDNATGDNHISCFEQALSEDNVKGFRDYIYKNKSNFYTECTILGSCRIRSLKKFLPEDKLWPTNALWDEHFVTNPYGKTPEETFVIKEKRLAEALYGDISTLERFTKKSQLAQADILRAEIDFARGNGEEITGHLNWMYNDIWGCGTWSVIDKYLERKPVYFAQKRAFQPFVITLTREEDGYFANVVNDTDSSFAGVLKVEDKTFDGRSIKSFSFEIAMQPRSVKKVLLPQGIRGGDYLLLQTGEYKTIYLPDDQSKLGFVSDLAIKKEKINEFSIRIKIKANAFAKSVFIDVPCVVSDITDNYFDMEAGEERVIVISCFSAINKTDVTVLTYADEWMD